MSVKMPIEGIICSIYVFVILHYTGADMVVSMRPYTPSDSIKSTIITSRYQRVHGAPIHIGDPISIGITESLQNPDFGDPVTIREVIILVTFMTKL